MTDTLKGIRETLCVAQHAISQLPDGYSAGGSAADHSELIGRMIAQIDLHRPLGPDGKHGDRHTPTCGCEDQTIRIPEDASPFEPVDWGRHVFDDSSTTNPATGQPWPLWAGSEPVDPPEPACVCGALWDSETNRCVMEAVLLQRFAVDYQRHNGRLLLAVEDVVRHIRGLRSLSREAVALIEAWDARIADEASEAEQIYGVVTRQVADMIEQAWCATTPSATFAPARGPFPNHSVTDVHPQMVTSAPGPVVYMVVRAMGRGARKEDNAAYGTYVDRGYAHELAQTLGAVVVEVPISADYREGKSW